MKRILCGIVTAIIFLQPVNLIAEEPVLSEPEKLIISEIMTGSEVNPEKDVWIELFNPNPNPIFLKGWQIRGVTKGGRWIDIFDGSGLSVEPGGFFLISYYSNSRSSALAVKPNIQKSSLAFPDNPINIELKNASGEVIDTAAIETTASEEFRSYKRTSPEADGTMPESWQVSTTQTNLKEGLSKTFATPGAENSSDTVEGEEKTEPEAVETQGSASPEEEKEEKIIEETVVWYPDYELISEIMVNPEGKDTEGEWIELFNPTPIAVDLGGWYLDDGEGGSSPFRLRDNTWLGGGSYKVFSEPDLKLSFKNSEDEVRLLDPNQSPKEVIRYSEAKEGWSYAKNPENEFVWTPIITPNAQNTFPPPPKSYLPDSIVFVNALPNPKGEDEGNEIISLKSNLGDSIDLSDWKIQNKKEKEYYLSDLRINSQETIEIKTADYGFSLINKEDQISLIDPSGNLIDQISWSDANEERLIYPNDYFTDGITGKVVSVTDGDTLKITIKDVEFTVRLIGIDAPESVHPTKPVEPFGIEAKMFLENNLAGQTVKLEFEENKFDKYNRLLAYVYSENRLLNAELIQSGLARVYDYFPFRKLDEFIQSEQEAKEQRVGVWSNTGRTEGEDNNPRNEEGEDNNPRDEENEVKEAKPHSPEGEDNNPHNKESEENEVSEIKCPTDGLKIASFMPNSEKGKTQEYITLTNESDQKICLHGWQLDDGLGIGSKPFSIKGGAIMPGGIRTFRKQETKLNLNNKNDCVNLISPIGKTTDRICYANTHKNEIFTHNGGNRTPKKNYAKQSHVPTKSEQPHKRPTTDYQWELKNESLTGEIVFIYEDGEVFYVKNEDKITPISYANSQVSLSAAKTLLDLNSNVELDVRTNGNDRELIAISQSQRSSAAAKQKSVSPNHWPLWLILLSGYPALWFYFKRKAQTSS